MAMADSASSAGDGEQPATEDNQIMKKIKAPA